MKNSVKVNLDLSIGLYIDSKYIQFYNVRNEEIISYEEYLELDKKEKENYVVNSVKDLINKGSLEDVYHINLTEGLQL